MLSPDEDIHDAHCMVLGSVFKSKCNGCGGVVTNERDVCFANCWNVCKNCIQVQVFLLESVFPKRTEMRMKALPGCSGLRRG